MSYTKEFLKLYIKEEQYGQLDVSFKLEDLPPANDKGYVRFKVSKMKEPKNDKTHYAFVLKKEGDAQPAPTAKQETKLYAPLAENTKKPAPQPSFDDDLPF